MKKPDATVWEDIRRAHLANEEALPIIAKRYKVTLNQISYRSRKEGWTPRPNVFIADAAAKRVDSPAAKAKPTQPVTKARSIKPVAAEPRSNVIPLRSAALTRTLVKRARERLADKLDNLRIQLTDGKRRKSTDSERESRDLLGIINGIAKTQEIENELHRLADANGTATANGRARATAIDPADLADRAESLRRTLADNIARRRQPQ